MKRTFLAVLALFLSTSSFAAETQRYLVATRHHPIAADVRQLLGEAAAPAVVSFETFTGFAADLTEAEAAALRASGSVRWVERVVERRAFLQSRNPTKQTVPLGIDAIFARSVQPAIVKGAVNVAVIDTGIDYRHPELKATFAGGRNVLNNTDNPLDDAGHGTHVSGTIAAADNDIGVVGIAPRTRLWAVKALDGTGRGTSETVLKGLDWVVAKKQELGGNWIVNLSLGADEESLGEREAFQRVADQGILVIAATGNASTSALPAPVSFPAAYPSVVAVGAVSFDERLASFSNQGPEVDLVAPGVGILSTLPLGSRRIAYVMNGDGDASIVESITGSKRGVVSGEFVNCGSGRAGDFPASVAGKIALIKRGESISFAEKTRRAKEAGAIAVAIFDNESVPSGSVWTLFNEDADATYEWPVAVRLTLQAGEALLAQGSHPITVAFTDDDYGEFNGTSMACPHVVGAASLLWGLAPAATPQQIVNALTATAKDLGAAGADPLFGAGLINVYAAAKFLAPQAFTSITTGRPVGMRGRR
ncbi:MAG: S8 family serine peptidase [Thermoanaerobaculia bacterium]